MPAPTWPSVQMTDDLPLLEMEKFCIAPSYFRVVEGEAAGAQDYRRVGCVVGLDEDGACCATGARKGKAFTPVNCELMCVHAMSVMGDVGMGQFCCFLACLACLIPRTGSAKRQ